MKRPRRRSSLIVTLLLALIVPILAACGGQPATTPGAAEQPSAAPAATGEPQAPATTVPDPTSAPVPSAAPSAAAGGTLVIGSSVWPDTLDPQKSSFSNEIAVLLQNYEGLTRFDKELKTVPAAAESWEYNADATQVTFTLREGLKYSDGSPLTAQDYIDTINRLLDPHSPGDYQTLLFLNKGAEDVINTTVPTDEARLPELQKALGVTAPDERTLVFDLTQPTPYFHTLVGTWAVYPAKQALVEAGGDTWYEDAANQIGNGPFQITTIDQSANLIEFEANENYWAGRPKLDAIQIRYIDDLAVALQAYQNGEIDMFAPDPNDVPTIKADSVLGKEYHEYPGSCTYTMSFNLTKAPFDNPLVRQAFAYGFDRESYVRDALKETEVATLTWIPPGYPGNDPSETRFGYDPEKARQLLAEAGYADGAGMPEIKYSYNSNNPANQARIEYLIQMFQQNLGVAIIPDPVEGTTLVNMRKSAETFPQITTGSWCADYPDQQNWLSVYWQSETNFAKNTGYKNEQVDQLLAQADVELDPAKRAQLYDEAQKLVIADQAQIMRSHLKNTYLVKSYVQGIDFTPQDSDFPGQITSLFNVTVAK